LRLDAADFFDDLCLAVVAVEGLEAVCLLSAACA